MFKRAATAIVLSIALLLVACGGSTPSPTPVAPAPVPGPVVPVGKPEVHELDPVTEMVWNCGSGGGTIVKHPSMSVLTNHAVEWEVGNTTGFGVKIGPGVLVPGVEIDLSTALEGHYVTQFDQGIQQSTAWDLPAELNTVVTYTLMWREVWQPGYIDVRLADQSGARVNVRYRTGIQSDIVGKQMRFCDEGRTYHDTTRETDNAKMVFVPAGEFSMGSDQYNEEKPRHQVHLDAFWIDKTEVTNMQYKKCVAAGKCKRSRYVDDADFNSNAQPVVGVDWNDAKEYCEWAGARLPTEAEWEKAARGTDGRVYPWGNEQATCEYTVIDYCGEGTWQVGSKPRGISPYGALDMAGNIWEWVADWFDPDYYVRSPERNPTGPDSGLYRVLRGGSWHYDQYSVRCSHRYWNYPDFRDSDIGFRCARS